MFGGSHPPSQGSRARPPPSAALIDREQVETQRFHDWGHRRSLPDTLHSHTPTLAARSRSAPDYARRGSVLSCVNQEHGQGQGLFSSSFLGMIFGMSDPSMASHRSSRRGSTVQGADRMRSLSSGRPLASAALIDREQLDSTQRTMMKRSLSLVSKLDQKQLTECSNPEPEPPKPRDLLDLNTLEEALPVVRAAVRFRTNLEKNKVDKPGEEQECPIQDVMERKMPKKIKPIIRQDHGRKRERKPHKLY